MLILSLPVAYFAVFVIHVFTAETGPEFRRSDAVAERGSKPQRQPGAIKWVHTVTKPFVRFPFYAIAICRILLEQFYDVFHYTREWLLRIWNRMSNVFRLAWTVISQRLIELGVWLEYHIEQRVRQISQTIRFIYLWVRPHILWILRSIWHFCRARIHQICHWIFRQFEYIAEYFQRLYVHIQRCFLWVSDVFTTLGQWIYVHVWERFLRFVMAQISLLHQLAYRFAYRLAYRFASWTIELLHYMRDRIKRWFRPIYSFLQSGWQLVYSWYHWSILEIMRLCDYVFDMVRRIYQSAVATVRAIFVQVMSYYTRAIVWLGLRLRRVCEWIEQVGSRVIRITLQALDRAIMFLGPRISAACRAIRRWGRVVYRIMSTLLRELQRRAQIVWYWIELWGRVVYNNIAKFYREIQNRVYVIWLRICDYLQGVVIRMWSMVCWLTEYCYQRMRRWMSLGVQLFYRWCIIPFCNLVRYLWRKWVIRPLLWCHGWLSRVYAVCASVARDTRDRLRVHIRAAKLRAALRARWLRNVVITIILETRQRLGNWLRWARGIATLCVNPIRQVLRDIRNTLRTIIRGTYNQVADRIRAARVFSLEIIRKLRTDARITIVNIRTSVRAFFQAMFRRAPRQPQPHIYNESVS